MRSFSTYAARGSRPVQPPTPRSRPSSSGLGLDHATYRPRRVRFRRRAFRAANCPSLGPWTARRRFCSAEDLPGGGVRLRVEKRRSSPRRFRRSSPKTPLCFWRGRRVDPEASPEASRPPRGDGPRPTVAPARNGCTKTVSSRSRRSSGNSARPTSRSHEPRLRAEATWGFLGKPRTARPAIMATGPSPRASHGQMVRALRPRTCVTSTHDGRLVVERDHLLRLTP